MIISVFVDEGMEVNVIYLNFSKAFNTTCHSILLYRLDQWTTEWVKKHLGGQAKGQ